ncbi:hypothetical protein WICANDRAFT_55693 [Wickerhamomyces anomalus NRRL Y-366-8]|uniref:Transcription elongation factor SPT4 n=1 Tax=Wickerhamomyces anomalus (strain ATCC 58044 / CBS 1984 / NCYC 433 / NRRL Y-366-8) TaxID=683960 RepID=A0A1E3P125_WICAA|nr:uncharacterized protein WICANDRAFT_55693 [Wickerhamomyces anomalus NRRL Y-366-8]ODQ59186.1 hypothetical protein WICANDRAFT_55693 [Wickerhamomyces anomalus NRRL Y-366-8]
MSSLGNRACMLCGIVESSRRFQDEGCPNCVDLLDVGLSTTSPTFEGLVAIGEPDKSWVAKWLRVNTYLPGLYAVKVMGRLPQDIIETLPYYRPRDGSATD